MARDTRCDEPTRAPDEESTLAGVVALDAVVGGAADRLGRDRRADDAGLDGVDHHSVAARVGAGDELEQTHPLLVVGATGNGKAAAFATDVAPHWIGPMVDWGKQRVTAQAEGTEGVEVGDAYAQFLQQLIGWL